MKAGPIKPKAYFAKLLGIREDEINYADNPPTTAVDWENAELLLPVTAEEFRAIEQFIRAHRSSDPDAPQQLA